MIHDDWSNKKPMSGATGSKEILEACIRTHARDFLAVFPGKLLQFTYWKPTNKIGMRKNI